MTTDPGRPPRPADRVVTVAPQSGRAVRVGRGELVRIADAEGHQVGDLWAIDAADPGRWLSAAHTRDRCERLFPAVGEQFRDQYGDPILGLVADTSPGLHDMLFPPCDPALYGAAGGRPGTAATLPGQSIRRAAGLTGPRMVRY